eukprot:1145439-Pelagomonas_calceolata.AAC.2
MHPCVFFTIPYVDQYTLVCSSPFPTLISTHAGGIFVASTHAGVLEHCRARWGVHVLALPAE